MSLLLIALFLIVSCLIIVFSRLNYLKKKNKQREIESIKKRLKQVMETEKNTLS